MLNRKLIIFVGVVFLLNLIQVTKAKGNKSIFGFFKNVSSSPDPKTAKEALENRGGLIWERPPPDRVAFPKVWRTFWGMPVYSLLPCKYEIRDIPTHRYEEAVNWISKNILEYHPIEKALNLRNDPNAVEFLKHTWRIVLKQRMSVACFRVGMNDFLGISILGVRRQDDLMWKLIEDVKYKSKNLTLFMDFYAQLYEFDTFKKYNVNKFLNSAGTAVLRIYDLKDVPIEWEFYKSREAMCKEFGITLTSGVFMSVESNNIADKHRYVVDKSISYDDIVKKFSRIKLGREDCTGATFRIKTFLVFPIPNPDPSGRKNASLLLK